MGKKPIGGRGHKNLYESTHARIPEPIKPLVESLADDYRKMVSECKCLDFDSRGLLPRVPAIYFVLEDEEIVYIGQTKNLLVRWRNHHITANFVGTVGKISIAWLQSQNTELLKVIEQTLIDAVQPRLNHSTGGQFAPKFEGNKKLCSFRLTSTAIARLDELALAHECTRTDVIEMFCRGQLVKREVLLGIAEFIESQRSTAGGNQHKPPGELRIDTSVHWRKLREFKEWIENEK
jgi:hypothetical protein